MKDCENCSQYGYGEYCAVCPLDYEDLGEEQQWLVQMIIMTML